MPSPTKLGAIVSQNSLLRQLFREAGNQQGVSERVSQAIDPSLRDHVRFALLRDETLILIADTSAWAARLRFDVANIKRRFATLPDFPRVTNIRVKVAAAVPVTALPQRRAQAISESVARDVEVQAETIEDPELREAMLRLARHRDGVDRAGDPPDGE